MTRRYLPDMTALVDRDDVDWVVVARLLAGLPCRSTWAEKLEVVRAMPASTTANEVARVCRCNGRDARQLLLEAREVGREAVAT